MIKLKNGAAIEYREDFDAFFRSMVSAVIKASLRTAADSIEKGENGENFNERLLREIMDNCIYITRQIQEISRKDEKLSSLLVTGCLFNCMIMSLSKLGTLGGAEKGDDDDDTLH
jgi:hypothetical protein